MHATSQSTVLVPARLRGGVGAYRGTTSRSPASRPLARQLPRTAPAPDRDWWVHPFVD